MTLLARLEISKMYLRDEQNGTGWTNSTGDRYMLFVHVNVKDPFSLSLLIDNGVPFGQQRRRGNQGGTR